MTNYINIKGRDNYKKYFEHKVFKLIDSLLDYYDLMDMNSFLFPKSIFCVKDYINIDEIMFASIKCTINSVKSLINIGSLNDAFMLIRKYREAVITNIYIDLILEQERDKIKNNYEENNPEIKRYNNIINKWCNGDGKLKSEKKESLFEFESTKELNEILKITKEKNKNEETELSKFTRKRLCNDHTHYNALKYFRFNISYLEDIEGERIKLLDEMYIALKNIFILHFSYMFVINPEYYRSDDYTDFLDVKETPPEGSQYWVNSLLQEMFDEYIKENKNLYTYLSDCNSMEIKNRIT